MTDPTYLWVIEHIYNQHKLFMADPTYLW